MQSKKKPAEAGFCFCLISSDSKREGPNKKYGHLVSVHGRIGTVITVATPGGNALGG